MLSVETEMENEVLLNQVLILNSKFYIEPQDREHKEQAGAELGQAQPQLGLRLTNA